MRSSLAWLLALLFAVTSVIDVGDADAQRRRRKKKKKKKKEDEVMTFEPDSIDEKDKPDKPDTPKKRATPPPDTTPPSKTLEKATKYYDSKQYFEASIEFAKVLNKETDDSLANQQRAEFFLGKTLYQLGFYAASLAFFDRIVSQGTGHRYYPATLKWLAALSRVLPETSGILEKVGTYDPAELEKPIMAEVRDELYYLLGRHFYRQGGEENFDQAVSLFAKVEIKSPFFVKAKFFEAVTAVRRNQGKKALNAFKEILVIGQERPEYYSATDIDQFEELANLQLARVFYTTEQFDTSIKYYEKIPQKSPDWVASLFEASWAYFMRSNNPKALGNIHTLNAPYFEDEFFIGMAESILLKAVIYYKYCLYDRAVESVAEYNAIYRPLRKEIKNILGQFEDDADFYRFVKKVLSGDSGLNEQMQRLVLSALSDRTLRKTFAWVDELERELKMLTESEKAWKNTSVAGQVQQELTVQQSLAEADAGRLARERLERLEKELRELSRDGSKIRIEVLGALAGAETKKATGGQISGDHKEDPIVVDDEHFMWDFNGEYWKDELGFYRARIASKCPTRGGN